VPSGQLSSSAIGTTLTWGLSGQKAWKRDRLDVGYFGSANHYQGNSPYSGGNHAVSLSYSRIVSRRLSLNLSQSLRSTSQGYALESQTQSGADSLDAESLATAPAIAAYDQGTRQASTTATVLWQKSSRLALNLSSSVFFVERRGAGFTGATGYQAESSANRRLTSRLTIGAYYSYANYVYSKHISVSSSNTAGGSASYLLDRRTQASLRLGLTEVESQSLTVVRLDPVIAAILGQSSGIISAYRRSRFQDVAATVVRDLGHRKRLNVSYAKGLAPGNGLIQASSRETLSGGFTMTAFRRIGLSFGATRDSLSSVEALAASYHSRGYSLSASRPLPRGMSANFTVDYRSIEGYGTRGLTKQLRIGSGVSWGRSDSKLW
jgi:hypothetical protein